MLDRRLQTAGQLDAEHLDQALVVDGGQVRFKRVDQFVDVDEKLLRERPQSFGRLVLGDLVLVQNVVLSQKRIDPVLDFRLEDRLANLTQTGIDSHLKLGDDRQKLYQARIKKNRQCFLSKIYWNAFERRMHENSHRPTSHWLRP